MKKFFIFLFIVALVLFFTNPTEEKHHQAMEKECKRDSPFFGWLCAGIATNLTVYDSYFIASRTSIKDKTISYGFLGMVFINREELKKEEASEN